jgi:hypothetical protein
LEEDVGGGIEQVFGPGALRNYGRGFKYVGRNYLLKTFPPGSPVQTLTAYLSSHGYRCRTSQSQTRVEHRCNAEYAELIYEMFRPSMLVSSLPLVTYYDDARGHIEDIQVYRFDEGQAIFGPYPE